MEGGAVVSFTVRTRGEAGAAALEFGLVMPLLLLILLGIIQYGFYFWGMQAGENAAGELVRRLSVGDCQDSTQAQEFVSSRVGSVAAGGVTVSVGYQDDTTGHTTMPAPGVIGGSVKVDVQFAVLNLHVPLVPLPTGGTVHRDASARVEGLSDPNGSCA